MLYIIRIGDGVNFNSSKHLNIWGISARYIRTVNEFNEETILVFLKNGNIILGFAKFESYYDIKDEPLIPINTEPIQNVNWINFNEYPLQIKYKDFIELQKEIKFIDRIPQNSIISFNRHRHVIYGNYDLYTIISIKYDY